MRNRFFPFVAMLAWTAALPACASAMATAEAPASPSAARERAGSRCPGIQDYVPGTAVQGELTSDDCFEVEADRREPLDVWRIRADGRRDLHLVVDAPGMEVRLRLLTEDGVEVGVDEHVGAFTFIVTQVPAGTYRLEVRSKGGAFGGRVFGRYVLRSSTDQAGFEGCPTADPLPATGVVRGEWSVEDCAQPAMMRLEMRYHDYYLLEVPVRRDVTVTLESPGVNGTLALFTRDGAPVAEAMSIGGPGQFAEQLAPGTYIVRVGVSLEAGRETGDYTLRIRQ